MRCYGEREVGGLSIAERRTFELEVVNTNP